MKTLFLLLVLPFSLMMSNQKDSTNLDNNPTTIESKRSVKVEVEMELGRKKKGCSGFGICSISGSAGIKGILDGNRVRATLIAQNGNVTSINFHANSMNKSTRKNYFSSRVFVVEENFSQSLRTKKGKIVLNLKTGKYKLKRSKLGFLLEVTG